MGMTKQRKAELRKKGAIVAWTLQDACGLCHLVYLKAQNGRFSVMREAEQADMQVAPAGGGYYRLDKKYKLPLLIMSIRNQLSFFDSALSVALRMRSRSVSKPIYLTNLEKVKVLPRIPRKALKGVK